MKSQAIELESRLREKRELKKQNSSETEVDGNSVATEVAESHNESAEVAESHNESAVSVEESNAITAQTDDTAVSDGKFSIENTRFEANDSPRSLHLDINSMATPTAATEMLSPNYSLHSSPSMGALNDSKNQTLYLTPYSARDTPEPDFIPCKLIRSNSYTLDTPSPLLLQLMEANGINANESKPTQPKTTTSSSQPSLTAKESRTLLPVKQAWTKSTAQSTKPTVARKSISPASSAREHPKKDSDKPKASLQHKKCATARNQESALRSIYGAQSTARATTKLKKPDSARTSLSGTLTARVEKPSIPNSIPVIDANTEEVERILKLIEVQHRTQMNALIERQRDEQRRMQEEFAQQQELLVKQISNLVLSAPQSADGSYASHLSKSITLNDTSMISTDNQNNTARTDSLLYDADDDDDNNISHTPGGHDQNGNCSRIDRSQPTPECMRRLVYYDDNQLVSAELDESNKSTSSDATVDPCRVQAATTITAYAKGYLTRRLFRAVKVQNIVKTIKDTLLFILDIHFENPTSNDSPADLKLKTHLIQQVCTNTCRALLRTYPNEFCQYDFDHFLFLSSFRICS